MNQKVSKPIFVTPKGWFSLLRILCYQETPIEEFSWDQDYGEKKAMRFEINFDRQPIDIFDRRWLITYDLDNKQHLEELFTEILQEIDNDYKSQTPLFKCAKCGYAINQKPPFKRKEEKSEGVTIVYCVAECPNCKTEKTSLCIICKKRHVNYYHEVCSKCYKKSKMKCNQCRYSAGFYSDELGETFEECRIYDKDHRLKKAVGIKHDALGKLKNCRFFERRLCTSCKNHRCGCEYYNKFDFNVQNTNKCLGYKKMGLFSYIKYRIMRFIYLRKEYQDDD